MCPLLCCRSTTFRPTRRRRHSLILQSRNACDSCCLAVTIAVLVLLVLLVILVHQVVPLQIVKCVNSHIITMFIMTSNCSLKQRSAVHGPVHSGYDEHGMCNIHSTENPLKFTLHYMEKWPGSARDQLLHDYATL